MTARSITTADLVGQLVDYGRENSVERVTLAAPYLEALARTFGDREAREVTARELHAFHQQVSATPAAGPLVALLEEKATKWEAAYVPRRRGIVGMLEWESGRPVRALVDLFDQPGFQPRRVLELGCGDGVNAVFMATRGCQVTAVDVSPTALAMAREKEQAAGVEIALVEGDVFAVDVGGEPFDFVFDRGMFHHLQVFQFEDYKTLVAERLVPDGWFHLICHHVSGRPTVLVDCAFGFVGMLLSFVSGTLVQMGAGFTTGELREVFSDRFWFQSTDLVGDDNNRPFRFISSIMQKSV